MNRHIGRWLQVGLFAALPLGWSGAALAEGGASGGSPLGGQVSGDKGINPLPKSDTPNALDFDRSTRTPDQKKAGAIDDRAPMPMDNGGMLNRSHDIKRSNDIDRDLHKSNDTSNDVNRGTSMGTSGSSGAVSGAAGVGQPGSEMNGSAGAIKTEDIQRSSGTDSDLGAHKQLGASGSMDTGTSEGDLKEFPTPKKKQHIRSHKTTTRATSRRTETFEKSTTPDSISPTPSTPSSPSMHDKDVNLPDTDIK